MGPTVLAERQVGNIVAIPRTSDSRRRTSRSGGAQAALAVAVAQQPTRRNSTPAALCRCRWVCDRHARLSPRVGPAAARPCPARAARSPARDHPDAEARGDHVQHWCAPGAVELHVRHEPHARAQASAMKSSKWLVVGRLPGDEGLVREVGQDHLRAGGLRVVLGERHDQRAPPRARARRGGRSRRGRAGSRRRSCCRSAPAPGRSHGICVTVISTSWVVLPVAAQVRGGGPSSARMRRTRSAACPRCRPAGCGRGLDVVEVAEGRLARRRGACGPRPSAPTWRLVRWNSQHPQLLLEPDDLLAQSAVGPCAARGPPRRKCRWRATAAK
jgi:hypothetical protein